MHCFKFPLFLFFSSLFLYVSLAEIICEDLPHDACAFSISSSGKRCLLETIVEKDYEVEYECRTSEVVVERLAGYIETDKCVRACGVDRNFVGISSDSLREPRFTAKLCAPACSHNCPNIVDLFFNLAAGEGVFLPDLCTPHHTNPRRSMVLKTEANRYSLYGHTPPSPTFDDFSASSSEETLSPNSSEDSDLAPSSEETPGPISSEESDSAPSSEEAHDLKSSEDLDLAPSSEEAPAPTPASTLAPRPARMQTLVLPPMVSLASTPHPAPAPAPIKALAPASTPALLGALASTPTPAPAPAPRPASLRALVSAWASTPTPSPLVDLVSAPISAPSPAPMG